MGKIQIEVQDDSKRNFERGNFPGEFLGKLPDEI
jgi:hypothetical protein